jgi:hypothetical protein
MVKLTKFYNKLNLASTLSDAYENFISQNETEVYSAEELVTRTKVVYNLVTNINLDGSYQNSSIINPNSK